MPVSLGIITRKIYAKSLNAKLYELSAVSAGKKDIRNILDEDVNGSSKVLFLDEIHRFNKVQQDFLLPYVERGEITLIGATTEIGNMMKNYAPLVDRFTQQLNLLPYTSQELAIIVEKLAGRYNVPPSFMVFCPL